MDGWVGRWISHSRFSLSLSLLLYFLLSLFSLPTSSVPSPVTHTRLETPPQSTPQTARLPRQTERQLHYHPPTHPPGLPPAIREAHPPPPPPQSQNKRTHKKKTQGTKSKVTGNRILSRKKQQDISD